MCAGLAMQGTAGYEKKGKMQLETGEAGREMRLGNL